MKISTSKKELQKALNKLSKAIPSRSTLPILSSVLFASGEDSTVLKSTDLEITIITKLNASVDGIGSVAIPFQSLSEITNELSDETRIVISSDDNNKIKFITDNGSYNIMGKSFEEFPTTPTINNKKSTNIDSSTIKDLIKRSSFAVSRDDLKPALTGVLFRFGEKQITCVATDGHRLVKYVKNNYLGGEYVGDVIIPKKYLNLILNNIDDNQLLTFFVGDGYVETNNNNDTYLTRTIDERFPDFESVIPKDNDKELIINKNLLLSAVKRVSIFSNKSTYQIALNLNKEEILITTEDPEKASKAQEKIDGNYDGDDLIIGYNASYLKDVLSHAPNKNIIIKLKSSISAALFYPTEQEKDTNLTMLLMPIRLNN